ncbi:MAG: uncharacterized protein QOH90_2087, partial [Actinomycetota bacterium]|nr:uncharacterized protein [Actinomycetota bacterium]
SPDEELDASDGFDAGATTRSTAVQPVTPAAFDPADIGAPAPPKRRLSRLLVTGDSLSTPLDIQLARKLVDTPVEVFREPHLGTGISKTFTVDWGELSAAQVRRRRPDAVVLFIGANEGFPMRGPDGSDVKCCGAPWAAVYASRVRKITDTYRRDGAARVYWITLPAARDRARARIGRTVNAAIEAAIAPWRAQVHLIDAGAIFTPDGYRDAMDVAGRRTIVRRADGIHLNDAGAGLLATRVLAAISREYDYGPG